MISDEVVYRRATLDDAEELAAFGSQSFVDAYGNLSNPGNLVLHVLRTYGPELQRAELSEDGTWSILGERDGELVAAALVRKRGPPADLVQEFDWAEIVRFYVARPYWKTGVSAGLMHATLRSLQAEGARGVWLQVWEHADHATRFYRKWGFLEVGEAWFQFGADRQRDLVMARSLVIPAQST